VSILSFKPGQFDAQPQYRAKIADKWRTNVISALLGHIPFNDVVTGAPATLSVPLARYLIVPDDLGWALRWSATTAPILSYPLPQSLGTTIQFNIVVAYNYNGSAAARTQLLRVIGGNPALAVFEATGSVLTARSRIGGTNRDVAGPVVSAAEPIIAVASWIPGVGIRLTHKQEHYTLANSSLTVDDDPAIFVPNGSGINNGVYMSAALLGPVTDDEAAYLSINPWSLFEKRQIFAPQSASVALPTLSDPTFVAGSLSSSGWIPQVTAS